MIFSQRKFQCTLKNLRISKVKNFNLVGKKGEVSIDT